MNKKPIFLVEDFATEEICSFKERSDATRRLIWKVYHTSLGYLKQRGRLLIELKTSGNFKIKEEAVF